MKPKYQLIHGAHCYPVPEGHSKPEILRLYGTEEQCEAALGQGRWPYGISVPVVISEVWTCLGPPPKALSGPKLQLSGQAHGWDGHADHKTDADLLIPGFLSDWPGQKLGLFTRAQPLLGRKLRNGLATAQQDPARNEREDGYLLRGKIKMDDS